MKKDIFFRNTWYNINDKIVVVLVFKDGSEHFPSLWSCYWQCPNQHNSHKHQYTFKPKIKLSS
jgi:hypothetical protein